MKPDTYVCEKCLGEQLLTLHDLILATASGPLRCTDPTCPGFSYLVSNEKTRRYMNKRDRSKPLNRQSYGRRP